jgi:hypothetical protein
MRRIAALLALAACTSSPPPAHVILGPPASAWSAPRVEPAHTVETCDAFRARMKAEIGVALASHAPDDPTDSVRAPDTFVGFCAETPNGSWRVEIPEWKSLGSYADIRFAIEVRYVVVHLSHDGVAARYTAETTLDDYGVRDARPPALFDFDGDGEPEIFVDVREVGDEGHVARQSALLTLQGGAVVPFAPAQAFDIDSLADVDADGRPDLKIYAGYTDTLEACFSGFPYEHPPPRFVAHSLPGGGFSAEDASAKKYALAWCPAAPKAIVDSADAICARLWSHDKKEVSREGRRVAASCVSGYCERVVQNLSPAAGSTPDCGRRQQWFEHDPPLTLP